MRHKTRATTFVVVRFRHRPIHSIPQTTLFSNTCVKNNAMAASDRPLAMTTMMQPDDDSTADDDDIAQR